MVVFRLEDDYFSRGFYWDNGFLGFGDVIMTNGDDLGVVVKDAELNILREGLLKDGRDYAKEHGLNGDVVVTPRDEAVLYGHQGAVVPLGRTAYNGREHVFERYEV